MTKENRPPPLTDTSVLPSDWNGRAFESDEVALWAAKTTSADGTSAVPAPILFGVAATGQDACLLHPDHVGAFLLAHRNSTLICHDAALLHWVLVHYLRGGTGGSEALEVLWGFSRDHRLVDVAILDQLVGLANGDMSPLFRPLHEIAATLTAGRLDAVGDAPATSADATAKEGNQIKPELLNHAVRAARVLLKVYQALAQSAKAVRRDQDVGQRSLASFGPLGLGVDVQGAIALHRFSRKELHFAKGIGPVLLGACENTFQHALDTMRQDMDARQCFKTRDGEIRLSKTGFPEFEVEALDHWLQQMVDSMRGLHEIRFASIDMKERRSTRPDEWGVLIRCNRLLCAWADLDASATLRHFVQSHPSPNPRPKFKAVPTIKSWAPDLVQIRRVCAAEVFQPAHDCSFLTVRFPDLELRALARVCERCPGNSQLAEIFRLGLDPNLHVAAALRNLTVEQFQDIQERQPDACDDALKTARALLFAVPRALGPAGVQIVAELDHGIKLTEEEVRTGHDQLTQSILPELAEFLRDPTMQLLADKLKISVQEVQTLGKDPHAIREFLLNRKYLREVPKIAKTAMSAPTTMNPRLRNYQGPNLLFHLSLKNKNRALQSLLDRREAGPELYAALFHRDIPILTGRVRGKMPLLEGWALPFTDLADAAMKMAMYAVVAAGYRPVAVTPHEFVLEVPVDSDDLAAVERIVSHSLERILHPVPAGCKAEWRERW